MRVFRQRWRMCATIRATSSTAPGRCIDVRPPQLRCQQVASAEDVERQIAVAVVVAMKEAAFLAAVQRIIRGVEVKRSICSGAFRWASRKRSTNSRSTAAGSWLTL